MDRNREGSYQDRRCAHSRYDSVWRACRPRGLSFLRETRSSVMSAKTCASSCARPPIRTSAGAFLSVLSHSMNQPSGSSSATVSNASSSSVQETRMSWDRSSGNDSAISRSTRVKSLHDLATFYEASAVSGRSGQVSRSSSIPPPRIHISAGTPLNVPVMFGADRAARPQIGLSVLSHEYTA